nr:glutamate receptor 1-like [Parasteatoda tepidariorum]
MNWSLQASHRVYSTSRSDVIIVWLTGRVSSGGDIMQETFLIWKLLCFTYILALVRPVPEKIPIGAIFTPGSEEMQTAFNYAVSYHNNNDSQARFKVEPVVEVLDSDDSYKIGQTLCLQMERGIFALIAPTSDPSYDTFAAYSNTFQMPFVSPAFPQQTSSDRPANIGVSLRPKYLRAVVDIINFYKWKTIIYLYDSDNVCLQMERGIFALIAPTSDPSYDTFAAYSNTFQMPFVSPAFPQQTSSDRPANIGVSLRPKYLRAVVDIINFYKWKTIIYLYDSDNDRTPDN